jgi:hypothetical protein
LHSSSAPSTSSPFRFPLLLEGKRSWSDWLWQNNQRERWTQERQAKAEKGRFVLYCDTLPQALKLSGSGTTILVEEDQDLKESCEVDWSVRSSFSSFSLFIFLSCSQASANCRQILQRSRNIIRS